MKKYEVSYIRRFKGKDNGVDYVSLELKATTPSMSKEGVYLGHKTYNVICKAEKFPADVLADDFVNCCVSFDKETRKPYAYNFSKCSFEESMDAISSQFVDSVKGTVLVKETSQAADFDEISGCAEE